MHCGMEARNSCEDMIYFALQKKRKILGKIYKLGNHLVNF